MLRLLTFVSHVIIQLAIFSMFCLAGPLGVFMYFISAAAWKWTESMDPHKNNHRGEHLSPWRL